MATATLAIDTRFAAEAVFIIRSSPRCLLPHLDALVAIRDLSAILKRRLNDATGKAMAIRVTHCAQSQTERPLIEWQPHTLRQTALSACQ